MTDDHTLVELARFVTDTEAHIASSAMEASGIDNLVLNDNSAAIGVGIGIVNARIMVRADDLQRAKNVMAEI